MNQFFLKLHVLVKSHEDFLLRLKSGLSFVQFWLYFFFRTQKYDLTKFGRQKVIMTRETRKKA